MTQSTIARRYAKAVADLCAQTKNHAVIGKQLESFASLYASTPVLRQVMTNPTIPLDEKKSVLRKIFERALFAATTRHLLLVLLEQGRMDEVGAVSAAFRQHIDIISGRIRATVVSAAPLERSNLTRIQAALGRLTGKTVLITARVDPALIGGVQVQLGTRVLDGSLKTQFGRLRERLLA